MTRLLSSLRDVAGGYDAIVLDQWGVLHDGTRPYPDAISALDALHRAGTRLAVLSNSGKRAAPNAARIASMGFPEHLFDIVMTSGEALWRDVSEGRVEERQFFPVERAAGDAAAWAGGLDITLCDTPGDAEAVLLMGLPDCEDLASWQDTMDFALREGLPVYCSNPDRASPRSGGATVISPGALAHAHRGQGGKVTFYGKPHRPIFDAVVHALETRTLLMVGDSLEHDISGAHTAGWDSALIQGGLYAVDFAGRDGDIVLAEKCDAMQSPAPTYRMDFLR